MEEKELNFCEILKGHENDKFYSPMFGDVYLNAILTQGQPYPINLIAGGKEFYINPNGYWDNGFTDNVMIVIYPSHDLYLKYPLDAKKAWDEWGEANKSKRWRAKNDNVEEYYFISALIEVKSDIDMRVSFDNRRYEIGNYFRTEEEAQQAAEAVKKCLEDFHSKHNQQ